MNYKALDEALEYLNNLEESEIDSINLDPEEYLEESNIEKISFGGSKGTCQIVVLSNEGTNYPHFHVKSTKGPNESVCISITRAEYYVHGHGLARLNSKEMKILTNWLDAKNKNKVLVMNPKNGKIEERTISNWHFICYDYDRTNGTSIFNVEASRPSYDANMPDMKEVKGLERMNKKNK